MDTEVQPQEPTDAELDAITSGEEIETEETVVEEVVEQVEEVAEKPEPEKMVPLAALHEARIANREMRQKVQQMEQRFQEIMGKVAPEPQLPGPDEDPVTNFHQRIAQLESLIEQSQRQTQEAQYTNQVVTTYSQHAAKFAEQEPSFKDAYSYLVNGRQHQYMEAGYSKEEATALTQREEFNVVQQALQMGLNPAAMVYNMAQTYGWKPREAAVVQNNLETVAKGMKANKSLSAAKGQPVDNVTLEAIASMSDEDFNKYWDSTIAKS